jgi:hypothetical protein
VVYALMVATAMAVPPEPFDDPATGRAPLTASAVMSTGLSLGDTTLGFLTLRGSVPLWYDPDCGAGLGFDLRAGVTGMYIPEEQRGAFNLREGWMSLWLVLEGPRRLTHHGFGIGGGSGLSARWWLDPHERLTRALVFYDVTVLSRYAELGARVATGPVNTSEWGWTGTMDLSAALTLKPAPTFGVVLGGRGRVDAAYPGLALVASLRFRPAPGWELGYDTWVPVTDGYDQGKLRTALSLRWWSHVRAPGGGAPPEG